MVNQVSSINLKLPGLPAKKNEISVNVSNAPVLAIGGNNNNNNADNGGFTGRQEFVM